MNWQASVWINRLSLPVIWIVLYAGFVLRDFYEFAMGWIESSFFFVGIAMCVLAVLPLALWSAQTWSMLRHNRIRFRESRELMRRQILDVSKRAVETPEITKSVGVAGVVAEPKATAAEVRHLSQPTVASDGTWNGFRKFIVARLVKETAICTSVYLTPADDGPIADFQAGQHLPLRFEIPGQPKPMVRCYSLSDGPGQSFYRISVKEMLPMKPGQTPGLVSHFVNNQLQVGDIVESRVPSGSFTLDLADSRPAVMLAGGIGITPMISMLSVLKQQAPDRVAILVYGVRNKADQAFHGLLQKLSAEYPNFHALCCYSNPQSGDVQGTDYHVKGFASVELLKRLLPDPDCQFYMCGPPPFMKSLSDGLEEWGVPKSRVFSEAFGPASIAKSATPANVGAAPVEVGAIKVTFDRSGKTAAWSPDCESLLELAEANGVDIDFGCRAGSCGTCATELLAGEVEYPEGHGANLEQGECLACIARPRGSIKVGA